MDCPATLILWMRPTKIYALKRVCNIVKKMLKLVGLMDSSGEMEPVRLLDRCLACFMRRREMERFTSSTHLRKNSCETRGKDERSTSATGAQDGGGHGSTQHLNEPPIPTFRWIS